MESTITKQNPRNYIGKSIKLVYRSKINQVNEIHGVINAVTKDNVCLIDFDKHEHIIKKSNIADLIEVKQLTKYKSK